MAAASHISFWRNALSVLLSLSFAFPPALILQWPHGAQRYAVPASSPPSSRPSSPSSSSHLSKHRPRKTHVDFFQRATGKVGNFSVAFNDCTTPIAGLPITVTRTYDTRAASVSGDFGYGWRLAIADVRLSKTTNLGKNWFEQADFTGFLGSFSLIEAKAHIVTITFPDDKVYKFQGQLTPNSQLAGPITAGKYTFVPLAPTLGSLTLVGDNDILVNGIPDEQNPLVPCTLNDFGSGIPFNPTTFQLTMLDGTIYVIDQFQGLKSITDTNGNTVTVTPNGLISSTGKSIVFQRDAQSRITSVEDCTGNKMYYDYDSSGNLIKFTDRTGDITQFTFDNTHKLLSLIDPKGVTRSTNGYDNNGRLTSLTDAFGKSITYTHDIPGRSETITNRLGNSTNFIYDDDGNVIRKTDAAGGVISYSYDARDNLLSVTDAVGGVTSYSYDSFDNVTSVTAPFFQGGNPADFTTRFTYNNQQLRTSTTAPTGAVINEGYDASGTLTSATDENGNPIMARTYGSSGNLVTETDAMGTIAYDSDTSGFVSKLTSPVGRVTQFVNDASGNTQSMTTDGITTTFTLDGEGRKTSTDNGNGITASFSYDTKGTYKDINGPTLGHMQRAFDSMGQLQTYTAPNGGAESYGYDDDGQLNTLTEPNGRITQYDRDPVGRIKKITRPLINAVTQFEYDLAGRITKQTDAEGGITAFTYQPCPCGCGNTVHTMTNPRNFTWTSEGTTTQITLTDPLNRVSTIKKTGHGIPYEFDNPDGTKKVLTYLLTSALQEAQKFPLSVTDEGNHVRSFTYDNFLRLNSATDLSGSVFQYTYSMDGIQSVKDPLGATIFQYTYDSLRNRKTLTTGDNATTTILYGPNNRPSTVTLPSGTTVSLTYDNSQRVLSRTTNTGESAGFTYNVADQIATTQDATGTTSYLYDVDGRLAEIDYPTGASIRYTYDRVGRVLQIVTKALTTSQENVVSYGYDPAGNLTSIVDPLNGTTTFTYDEVNRCVQRVLPNGVKTVYGYNQRDQITSITHTDGNGVVLASANYTRQGIGEPSRIDREDGSYVLLNYDTALRITSESYYSAANLQQRQINYTYDLSGNRTTRTDSGNLTTYSYNPGYLLASGTGQTNESYTYDPNGNTTGISRSGYNLNLQHDSRGEVTSVQNQGTGIGVQYTYDSTGRRVKAATAGTVRQFLVGPANSGELESPHLITDGQGNVLAGYVYAGRMPIMKYSAAGPIYYLEDAVGSVLAATSPAGAKVGSRDYDSFGNVRNTTGVLADPANLAGGDFAFQGMWLESGTGIYHVRARDYDSATGRFLSGDPAEPDIRRPETLHRYIFANSNPQLFADPTGRFNLIEINVTSAIDSTLNTIKSYVGQKAKEEVRKFVGQVFADALGNLAQGFFPANILSKVTGAFKDGDAAPSVGNLFGQLAASVICGVIDIPNGFWVVPELTTSGDVVRNGLNCGSLGSDVGLTAEGNTRPDFIFTKSGRPPKNADGSHNSAWVIGDFKLSGNTLVKSYIDPGNQRDQWDSIVHYSVNHAMRASLFISVWPVKQENAGKISDLLVDTGIKEGAVVLLLSILDQPK